MRKPDRPEPDAFDQLTADARVKGQTRVIPDGCKPGDVTREQALAVARQVREYHQQTGLKLREIARAIGMSGTTLGELLAESLCPGFGENAIDLDRWLEAEHKRAATPRPTDFVMTRVAEQVFTVAEAATSLKGIGLVYGWAGIGKTMALQAVAAEKPGSIFVSIKTSAATPLGVLQAIALGSGMLDTCRDTQRTLTGRLEELLRGTPRLIIIDEIHKLCGLKDDRALHVLRDLHDATGVPMLWSGTTDLVAYLERRGRDRGREPLAQIRSRICVSRDLTDVAGIDGGGPDDGGGGKAGLLYTVEEIRRAFARNKMRLAPDAAQYLAHLANIPESGGLRTCRNLVVLATKINGGRAEALTAEMLRGVHGMIVSRRDYTTLQGQLAELAATRQPVARVG